MWYRVREGLYVVTPGFSLPEHNNYCVAPAICAGEKSYLVFFSREPWHIAAQFNEAPPIEIGDAELIAEAKTVIEPHKWITIKGPNYLRWIAANIMGPVETAVWGQVYRAAIMSDLGSIGWCLHDGQNVLYYEFEYNHINGVHAGYVSRRHEKPLRQLAEKLRFS